MKQLEAALINVTLWPEVENVNNEGRIGAIYSISFTRLNLRMQVRNFA